MGLMTCRARLLEAKIALIWVRILETEIALGTKPIILVNSRENPLFHFLHLRIRTAQFWVAMKRNPFINSNVKKFSQL